jgi:methionine-R-sulfoxide reductase
MEKAMKENRKTREAITKFSPEQFRVTQRNGTEGPGSGQYLEDKEAGSYVDVVSGEPLFASSDKYESDCGWPIFTRPIEPAHINERRDASHGMVPHRSALDTRRQSSRARVPRWARGSRGTARLQQLGVAALRPPG